MATATVRTTKTSVTKPVRQEVPDSVTITLSNEELLTLRGLLNMAYLDRSGLRHFYDEMTPLRYANLYTYQIVRTGCLIVNRDVRELDPHAVLNGSLGPKS